MIKPTGVTHHFPYPASSPITLPSKELMVSTRKLGRCISSSLPAEPCSLPSPGEESKALCALSCLALVKPFPFWKILGSGWSHGCPPLEGGHSGCGVRVVPSLGADTPHLPFQWALGSQVTLIGFEVSILFFPSSI